MQLALHDIDEPRPDCLEDREPFPIPQDALLDILASRLVCGPWPRWAPSRRTYPARPLQDTPSHHAASSLQKQVVHVEQPAPICTPTKYHTLHRIDRPSRGSGKGASLAEAMVGSSSDYTGSNVGSFFVWHVASAATAAPTRMQADPCFPLIVRAQHEAVKLRQFRRRCHLLQNTRLATLDEARSRNLQTPRRNPETTPINVDS